MTPIPNQLFQKEFAEVPTDARVMQAVQDFHFFQQNKTNPEGIFIPSGFGVFITKTRSRVFTVVHMPQYQANEIMEIPNIPTHLAETSGFLWCGAAKILANDQKILAHAGSPESLRVLVARMLKAAQDDGSSLNNIHGEIHSKNPHHYQEAIRQMAANLGIEIPLTEEVLKTGEEIITIDAEKPPERIFQDALQRLCAEIEQYSSPEDHPDFYGKPGNNSYTYKREVAGTHILIKVYKLFGREYAGNPARCFSSEVRMLESMKGNAHVPQILYSSERDFAIGMTILEGKSITTFEENPVFTCPDAHIMAFIETIMKLAEKNMYLELLMNSDNILFSKNGLSIVDISHNERKRHIAEYLESFAFAITNTRPAIFEQDVQAALTQRVQFTLRFVRILKEKFPEVYAQIIEINKMAPRPRLRYFSPIATMELAELAKRRNMLQRPEELVELEARCRELEGLIGEITS